MPKRAKKKIKIKKESDIVKKEPGIVKKEPDEEFDDYMQNTT